MKKTTFLSLLLTLIASAAYAQFYKDMEIKAETNLSSQYIHSVNEEPQTAFKSGWQFGLAKQWKLTNLLFAELGTGVSQHGSKVLTQSQNMWGGEVNSWEEVRLRYGLWKQALVCVKRWGALSLLPGLLFVTDIN